MSNNTKDILLSYVLTPLSWIYGAVTAVRNKMFDKHILKEKEFDIPVICVGNLTVGGTGKTPLVEYIAENLCREYNIGIVSRGYKRKTKGYILANSKSTPDIIGDEPYQMLNKLGNSVRIAVCEKRSEGIARLREAHPEINLILLDDAFQHRYVKPSVSVLLVDYTRPVFEDKLLPLGRLRESLSQIYRAEIVVVTKCPEGLMPIDYSMMRKGLDLFPYQDLFFSRYSYRSLEAVFPDDCPYQASLESLGAHDSVLLLTGIAHPRPFVRHFKQYSFKKRVSHFPDHHDFTRRNLQMIEHDFNAMKGERKIIVTTEKDAVRLANNPYFPEKLKALTFFIPIDVNMIEGNASGYDSFMDALRRRLREAVAKKSSSKR